MRDKSEGKRGVKDLIGELAKIYGPNKPFDDAELIAKVTELTYPEVGEFLQTYVVTGGVIDYAGYLSRVGVEKTTIQVPEDIAFVINRKPYIVIESGSNNVKALNPEGNDFFTSLGVKEDDVLLSLNGSPFNGKDKMSVILLGYKLKEGSPVKLKVNRNGSEIELTGTVKLNHKDGKGFLFNNKSKEALKNAWLKG
jgi:predicted metalloprotease with PDZ domain